MKKLLIIFAVIGLMLIGTNAARVPSSTNLLTNPGAETGDLTGWTVIDESEGGPVGEILFLDNFEDQGWDLRGDGWSIETETGNYVLSSSTGGHFAFATLQHPGWYDFRFKSRVKFISGDTYCELLFRIDDLGQHYWLQVQDGLVALAKESGTAPYEILASAPMSILQNTWYDFEIATRDNKIQVYVNGSPKINVKDDDPWGNIGTIGFEVHENTYVYFDDVLVTRLGDKK